jgi:hypothetical protein
VLALELVLYGQGIIKSWHACMQVLMGGCVWPPQTSSMQHPLVQPQSINQQTHLGAMSWWLEYSPDWEKASQPCRSAQEQGSQN